MVESATPFVYAALMPHPPIVVPAVGRGEERHAAHTCAAMRDLAAELVSARPSGLVVLSPHSPRRRDAIGLYAGRDVVGDFGQFGAPKARVDLPGAPELALAFEDAAAAASLRTFRISQTELDHGASVPLAYLVGAGWSGPTLVIGLPTDDVPPLAALAAALRQLGESSPARLALLASGDMSHRLRPGAPAGHHPRAPEFDASFVDALSRGALTPDAIDPELRELAAEDVVDSTLAALAAQAFPDATPTEVLSYEGPWGVGYCVARLPAAAAPQPREPGESLPALARHAVESWVRRGVHLASPVAPTGYLARRAGVFVTLRGWESRLRGGIGHLEPVCADLLEETVDRAVAAASSDPRFPKVEESELSELHYEVSVLHDPEPVTSTPDLDPAIYGVIGRDASGARAVLLPGIDGIDTVERQLEALREKAEVAPDTELELSRFRVDRFEESA